ncbi:MAG: DUF438 domain-containing protein [Desulfurella sp.]|uniref:DUF438 domain-containing protein n=1 Tax=Desulfurella sp. TaxID=1962857 RepID=UPI003D0E78FF
MLDYKPKDKFSKLLEAYPNIPDYLYSRNPLYKMLTNKVIVQLMAPRVDLAHVAIRGGYSFEEFLQIIENGIKSGFVNDKKSADTNTKEIKEKLKAILKQIYNKENVEEAKKRFKDLIEKADPVLIAVVESELKNEGYTTDDLMKACNIHMELFKEQISSSRKRIDKDHPLYRLIKDHDAIMMYMENGFNLANTLKNYQDYASAQSVIEQLKQIIKLQKQAEDNHNTRQENTLFPVIEKYGVEEPPSIMWQDHYNMKQARNRIEKLLDNHETINYEDFVDRLVSNYRYMLETFALHTKKEQEILYNVALDMLSDKDWADIKSESDELGYFELPKEVQDE